MSRLDHPNDVNMILIVVATGLAWLEIRVILTKLIWHFDIEWKGKHFKWEDQKTFINWKREHLTIGLRPVIRA